MALAFTFAQYREFVRQFGTRIPALLSRHPATSDLALEVARLHILEALEGRFTVAVVGQMRVGKSTLLNSLIGRDLAPTGVNETTATINWFRYGEGALCENFRAHGLDGSSQDVPLEQVAAWLGSGDAVGKTRWLDFFATSEFLRTANLVDTPGTRSVLNAHEGATRDFMLDDASLLDRCEDQTRSQGSKADAVLYVLNPVARQDDSDLLQLFGEKTRMAGATVHNSIAVIQKWENLDEEDPLAAAELRCERLLRDLQGKVAAVIPTSGLMAVTARCAPPAVWPMLADLVVRTSEADHAMLVVDPEIFCDPDDTFEQMPVPAAQRKALLKRVPWPVVRFALREGRRRGIKNGEAMLQFIRQASGVDRLRQLLESRFFAQAELIKANTVLRRAWTPCSVALLRLQEAEQGREADLRQGRESQSLLQGLPDSSTWNHVRAYVRNSLTAVEADLAAVRALRRELDVLRDTARRNSEALDRDMRAIDETLESDLAEPERDHMLRLLGRFGAEIATRLGVASDASSEVLEKAALDRLQRWQARAVPGARHARIFGYGCERLDQILDALENPAQLD